MLGRYRKSLVSLFQRVHELEADRVGKRLLALQIQEQLLVPHKPCRELVSGTLARSTSTLNAICLSAERPVKYRQS